MTFVTSSFKCFHYREGRYCPRNLQSSQFIYVFKRLSSPSADRNEPQWQVYQSQIFSVEGHLRSSSTSNMFKFLMPEYCPLCYSELKKCRVISSQSLF